MTEQPDRPAGDGGRPDEPESAPSGPAPSGPAQSEPAPPESGSPEHHHHTIREEMEVLRDEARVDSYRWGQTIMLVVLVVLLVVIAVAGVIWLL